MRGTTAQQRQPGLTLHRRGNRTEARFGAAQDSVASGSSRMPHLARGRGDGYPPAARGNRSPAARPEAGDVSLHLEYHSCLREVGFGPLQAPAATCRCLQEELRNPPTSMRVNGSIPVACAGACGTASASEGSRTSGGWPRPLRYLRRRLRLGGAWQVGHTKVERPACTMRSIFVPHTTQGSPSRSYTCSRAAKPPRSPRASR
jgi:hypothetical protein